VILENLDESTSFETREREMGQVVSLVQTSVTYFDNLEFVRRLPCPRVGQIKIRTRLVTVRSKRRGKLFYRRACLVIEGMVTSLDPYEVVVFESI